jgi:VanZ family protein
LKRSLLVLGPWLPVIIWSAIIALETTFGSAANTGRLLAKFARVFGQVDPQFFDLIHFILRKGGHFLGYGVLGYLCFSALLHTSKRATLIASAGFAIVYASFVAVLDEWHQSFLPDRMGQFQDVVLDAFGAVAIVSLALILRRIRRKPLPASP